MSCSIGLQLARRALLAGARSSSSTMQAPGWAAQSQSQQRQLQYHGAERQRVHARPMAEVAGLHQPAVSSSVVGHHAQLHKPTFVKALLLDVAGTLLSPSEPVTDVYRRYGAEFDLQASSCRSPLSHMLTTDDQPAPRRADDESFIRLSDSHTYSPMPCCHSSCRSPTRTCSGGSARRTTGRGQSQA